MLWEDTHQTSTSGGHPCQPQDFAVLGGLVVLWRPPRRIAQGYPTTIPQLIPVRVGPWCAGCSLYAEPIDGAGGDFAWKPRFSGELPDRLSSSRAIKECILGGGLVLRVGDDSAVINTRNLAVLFSFLVIGAMAGGSAQADLLGELTAVVDDHDRVRAAEAQRDEAQERLNEAYAVYYPVLEGTSTVGRERRLNPGGAADTTLTARELSLTLTQSVYDFGASRSTVDLAKLGVGRSEAVVGQVRQDILLEALAAKILYVRAEEVLSFAQESVENIKRQAELEDARVTKGGGFSTDVLQAKTELAGAEAREVLAEGDLRTAVNRHIAVFGFEPDDGPLAPIEVLPDMLPGTLDIALETARDRNRQLDVARIDQDLSKGAAINVESDLFYPDLDIVGEQRWETDREGTIGTRTESIIRLELSYAFDFGLTLRNSVRAADAAFRSTQHLFSDVRDLVDEEVRNAWNGLETAQRNADLLANQAEIAAQFLELAREERKAGRRSLIDVLAGETALINARSDAASARADVTLASVGLLAAMGVLGVESIRQQ